jgi:hypothetical protein
MPGAAVVAWRDQADVAGDHRPGKGARPRRGSVGKAGFGSDGLAGFAVAGDFDAVAVDAAAVQVLARGVVEAADAGCGPEVDGKGGGEAPATALPLGVPEARRVAINSRFNPGE